jgi:hypothetical protein
MESDVEGIAPVEHDHAWRCVTSHEDGVFGEYRCDTCNAVGASDLCVS